MRWLLIFAPAVLAAQSIVQLPAGSLSCGAVKRSVDEIQVYCAALRNAKWRYLDNDLFVVEGTGATYKKQTWNDSPDVIEWTFTPIAGIDEIDYTVTVNGIPGKPGKLTGIFGQPPPQALLDPAILVPCTTQRQHVALFGLSPIPTLTGMGTNQDGEVTAMHPWGPSLGTVKYDCLGYHRRAAKPHDAGGGVKLADGRESCCTPVAGK